jgi:nucleoid DNA-binding protein
MTRREIVDLLSREIDIPKKYIDNIVVSFLDIIKNNLMSLDTIYLRGFGTFGIKKRNETIRRNPRTNEKIKVPGHHVVYFKPGKELKEIKKQSIDKNDGIKEEEEVIAN